MRTVLLACVAALVVFTAMRVEAFASSSAPGSPIAAPSTQSEEVDDNGDTRVEVQLVVLGIAVGTVFVFGSGAYLLRKRLGLVAPPPEEDAAASHAGGHH